MTPRSAGATLRRPFAAFALPAREPVIKAPSLLGRPRAGRSGRPTRPAEAGVPWMLLLPSLELGDVLCIGLPTAAALRTLTQRATSVRVVCATPSTGERARVRLSELAADRVSVVVRGDEEPATEPVDLAIVTGWRAYASLAGDPALAEAVKAARVAFVSVDGPGWPTAAPARARRAAMDLGGGVALRLAPASGEIRTVAAEDDVAAAEFLERLVLPDRGRRPRRLAHASARRGLLVVAEEGCRLAPPAYVRAIAAAAGVKLDDHRAALSLDQAVGQLHLFAPEATQPSYVVEVAREPARNPALQRAWNGLRRLGEAQLPDASEQPQPAFLGEHAGLAVMGTTAVDGTPFHRRTTARADCALARAAVAWLVELGAATIAPPGIGEVLAGRARRALARFLAVHRLSPTQTATLEAHVDRLASTAGTIPAILAHGNPTTANLFVTDAGRPVFVGWHHAAVEGPPLWDILAFLDSYALTVARASGIADPLAGVRRHLLGDAPLHRVLVDAVERQCVEVGLDRGLVGPLALVLWMRQAAATPTSHHAALVRLCLDEPELPGLHRLFGEQVPAGTP